MVKTPEYGKEKWKRKTTVGFRKRWKKNATSDTATENYINGLATFLGIDPSYVRDEAELRNKGIEAVDVEAVVRKFDPEKWYNNLREAIIGE